MDYSTLIAAKTVAGSLRNYVNRDDIPAESILVEAEAYIYERLRVREMMAVAPLTVLAGASEAPLPLDFLDPVQFTPYGRDRELPYVNESVLLAERGAGGSVLSGSPSRWAVIGLNFLVDVSADDVFSGTLIYYQRPAALSVGNETNFLTVRYATALRLTAMAFAYEHRKDSERATAYFGQAEKEIAAANATAQQWQRNQRPARSTHTTFDFELLTSDKAVSGSIRNLVDADHLPAELILTEAQAWIYERLRAREMMVTAPVTILSGFNTASVPADYLDPIQLLPYGTEKELPFVHEVALAAERDASGALASGTPARWTVIGSTVTADVLASADFSSILTYFAQPAALATGNLTNFLTVRYPTMLRQVCLGFALEYLGMKDRSAEQFALAEKAIQTTNDSAALARRNQRAARIDTSTVNFSLLTADKAVAGSIRNLVKQDDIAAELMLTEAQAMIYERLRVREMLADIVFTFDANTSSEALPANFLDPIDFVPWLWGCSMPYLHEQTFYPGRDEAGVLNPGLPSKWTIKGETAHVDVLCDAAFSGRLTYYARPTALGTGNETNFLSIKFPTLLRTACLVKAFEHMGEWGRAAEQRALFEKAISDAAKTSDMARRGQLVDVL